MSTQRRDIGRTCPAISLKTWLPSSFPRRNGILMRAHNPLVHSSNPCQSPHAKAATARLFLSAKVGLLTARVSPKIPTPHRHCRPTHSARSVSPVAALAAAGSGIPKTVVSMYAISRVSEWKFRSLPLAFYGGPCEAGASPPVPIVPVFHTSHGPPPSCSQEPVAGSPYKEGVSPCPTSATSPRFSTAITARCVPC